MSEWLSDETTYPRILLLRALIRCDDWQSPVLKASRMALLAELLRRLHHDAYWA